MHRPRLEVADIFHRHGADCRANAGHVSLAQLQVMSAIEQCRSAALGGHVERCQDCGHSRIAYNRMARPVCKRRSRECLISLHQRIRSQRQALAEMEIRAPWSS